MPTINPLSCVAIRLQQLRRGTVIGYATGFFQSIGGKLHLVTCWHSLTCRERSKPQQLLPHAPDSPDGLRIRFLSWKEGGEGNLNLTDMTLPLYDQKGDPTWIEPPINGADMAAIPLEDPAFKGVKGCSELAEFEDGNFGIGGDLAIIGFPLGLTAGESTLPIWKRGTIASEPEIDLDGLPKFFIDASTRGGMSGAPVIGILRPPYKGADNNTIIAGPTKLVFLGVYSGHIDADPHLPEIGIVWKCRLLKKGGWQRGQNPFPPTRP